MTQPLDPTPPRSDADDGLHHLAQDTMGFGVVELKTAWAMIARPMKSLDAYMQLGPTAGGTLARPLRLYLALNAILMLVLFLQGGLEGMFQGLPADSWDALAREAGKTPDEFAADAEGWVTLTLVPLTSAVYALMMAPFLRWWDPDHLGWRKSFRATFVYLNAMTVPFMPLAWFLYDPSIYGYSSLLFFALSIYTFLRMGRGRWFKNWVVGALKAFALFIVLLFAQLVAIIPLIGIGYLGGMYGA